MGDLVPEGTTDPRLPEVVGGDADGTRLYIDFATKVKQFKNPFTSAMLSHDIAVPNEKQCALVTEYLAVLLPGRIPGLDFQFVAIAHREHPKKLQPLLDKDGKQKTDKHGKLRFEKVADTTKPWRSCTHVIVANIDIATGHRLQPYFHRTDGVRVTLWRNLVNQREGWSSPIVPSDRAFYIDLHRPVDVRERQRMVTEGVKHEVTAGRIRGEADLLRWFADHGLRTIEPRKPKSISIQHPDDTPDRPRRNIRFDAPIFALGAIESLGALGNAQPVRPQPPVLGQAHHDKLDQLVAARGEELVRQFNRGKRIIEDKDSPITPSAGDSVGTPVVTKSSTAVPVVAVQLPVTAADAALVLHYSSLIGVAGGAAGAKVHPPKTNLAPDDDQVGIPPPGTNGDGAKLITPDQPGKQPATGGQVALPSLINIGDIHHEEESTPETIAARDRATKISRRITDLHGRIRRAFGALGTLADSGLRDRPEPADQHREDAKILVGAFNFVGGIRAFFSFVAGLAHRMADAVLGFAWDASGTHEVLQRGARRLDEDAREIAGRTGSQPSIALGSDEVERGLKFIATLRPQDNPTDGSDSTAGVPVGPGPRQPAKRPSGRGEGMDL